jgi:hypothetical protein
MLKEDAADSEISQDEQEEKKMDKTQEVPTSDTMEA